MITAAHCTNIGGVNSHLDGSFVNWQTGPGDSSMSPYSNVSVFATSTTPSVIPFAPRWWRTLNQLQIIAGTTLNDWPAQHDHQIVHVPGLTAEVLAKHRVEFQGYRPVVIAANPSVPISEQYQVSSNNSSTNSFRDFVEIEYLSANPGTITSSSRDGYFKVDDNTSLLTAVQGGDSGGPGLGESQFWYGGQTLTRPNQVLLSTMQNSGGDSAPASYAVDLNLTANQQYTVRLNHLWLTAMSGDSDRDLIPAECDQNTNSADFQLSNGVSNQCPSPLGSVQQDVPRAGLICPAGYAATGIRGFADDEIRELAVQCTPLGALLTSDQTNVGRYWTDHFAGEDNAGSYFEETCASGEALHALFAYHDAGMGKVHGILPYCSDVQDSNNGGTANLTALSLVGSSSKGVFSFQDCDGPIRGFDVQSTATGFSILGEVNGMQTVCMKEFSYSDWIGSTGGGYKPQQCPPATVAVGVVSGESDQYAGKLGPFGFICQSRARIDALNAATSWNTVVAHPSWYDGASGAVHPEGVTQSADLRYLRNHGAQLSFDVCDGGQYLGGVYLHKPPTGQQELRGVYALICVDAVTGSFGSVQYVNVGDSSQSIAFAGCSQNGQAITEFAFNSGWGQDGVAVGCSTW